MTVVRSMWSIACLSGFSQTNIQFSHNTCFILCRLPLCCQNTNDPWRQWLQGLSCRVWHRDTGTGSFGSCGLGGFGPQGSTSSCKAYKGFSDSDPGNFCGMAGHTCIKWYPMDLRTLGFPGEQGIVMRWSMLLTSPVSGFNFVADQRMRNSHCLTGHQGLNPDVYSSSLLLYVPSVQHQESRRVPSSSRGRLPKCSSMR